MRKLTMLLLAGLAIFPAASSAHTPEPWSLPGHGPTIDCNEAIMLTQSMWMAGPEGKAQSLRCIRRINSSAVVVRSGILGGRFPGVYDTTVDWDAHHGASSVYDDRTWFVSRSV